MILCFGEIMLRLTAPGRSRLRQAVPGALEATFGGGEANVAVSLAQFGDSVRYVTALPRTPIAEGLIAQLRGFGVDTSRVAHPKAGRLGIYFLETGANQRPSVVVYDREHSAIALAPPETYHFLDALEGVSWVHLTGITPALSEHAFQSTLALAQQARAAGARVSCDLNFRKKLWTWKRGAKPTELARECMGALLPFVDVAIANEEDAKDVFGLEAEGASIEGGHLAADAYAGVARRLAGLFPNLSLVAITLRESHSADYNKWGGLLYDVRAGQAHLAPLDAAGRYQPYEIHDIVDRVGGGDSFGAGLIHALKSKALSEPAQALRFAVAASCLKHSIPGDFNIASEAEVLALMAGSASGRVQR